MASYFISHSSACKPFCTDLANEIAALGHVAWLDAFDIAGGASIPKSIVDGIYGSDFFVLVITPEVHTSVWVPWEIELATYREVQVLRRTFVVPATRVQSAPVHMIAHKNHLHFGGSAVASAAALVAATTGTAPVQPAPSLPTGSHMLMFEMTPTTPGMFSLRTMDQLFWSSLTVDQAGFSYFPMCRKGQNISVGTKDLVIQLGDDPRRTTTVLNTDGSLRIIESAREPVMAADLVRKIARFVKLSYDYAAKLGVEAIRITVAVPGTDREFLLSYHPADLTNPMGKPKFELPAGHPLNAAAGPSKVVVLDSAQIVQATQNLQADLFYPLRGQPMTMLRSEESFRYRDDAVERFALEALGNAWS